MRAIMRKTLTSSDTTAFGDIYDAAAFSMTFALGAVVMPVGNGKSRAKRAYSMSMCLMNGDERARLANSGSSSSNACESYAISIGVFEFQIVSHSTLTCNNISSV